MISPATIVSHPLRKASEFFLRRLVRAGKKINAAALKNWNEEKNVMRQTLLAWPSASRDKMATAAFSTRCALTSSTRSRSAPSLRPLQTQETLTPNAHWTMLLFQVIILFSPEDLTESQPDKKFWKFLISSYWIKPTLTPRVKQTMFSHYVTYSKNVGSASLHPIRNISIINFCDLFITNLDITQYWMEN